MSDDNASPNEPSSAAIADQLVMHTIAMIAHQGLDKLSLRTIAARSGCSTAYIFQKFGNRDGLVLAALDRAIAIEQASHADLLEQLSPLPVGQTALGDFLCYYVETRAAADVPRFMLSWVANSVPAHIAGLLGIWHTMRRDFWEAVSLRCGLQPDMPAILAAYALMEESYAVALQGSLRYDLLLKETIRALLGLNRSADASEEVSIADTLNVVPPPLGPGTPDANGSIRDRLLFHAREEILQNGIGAVNQRSAARNAGASNSAIAYYFGSMDAFVDEAIWRAMLSDIPPELDPNRTIEGRRLSVQQWLTALSRHLQGPDDGQAAGFYCTYARLTVQTCLLAHSRPSLKPLVVFLRELDGWGTYRTSRNLEATFKPIGRDQASAFAIWIKGSAVINAVADSGNPITVGALRSGAAWIFETEQQ